MLLKLDTRSDTVVFAALGLGGRHTKAKFDTQRYPKIKQIFEEGLHKIMITVNSNSVILYADCVKIGTKKMRPKESQISTSGTTIIGSDDEESILFQKLKIYCDPLEAIHAEKFCCELPNNPHCPLRVPEVTVKKISTTALTTTRRQFFAGLNIF